MFLTLCYIYLWLRYTRCYSAVLRNTLRRSSSSRCGFTFCALRPERCPPPGARGHHHQNQLDHHQPASSAAEEDEDQPGSVLLTVGDKAVFITEPQVITTVNAVFLLNVNVCH